MDAGTSMVLSAIPLQRTTYSPYGDVIATDEALPFSPANFGRAKRYNWLSDVRNLREQAKLNVCIFSYNTKEVSPFKLQLLEKHPHSTQVFLPMSKDSKYITIVALGGDEPDLSTIKAFTIEGAQGISYHPGIWHYPMTVIGSPMDFTCLVYEDNTEEDCVIWPCKQDISVQF